MKTLNKALSITISLLLLCSMVYAQTSVNHNSGNDKNISQPNHSSSSGLIENGQEIKPSPMMKLNKMQKLPSLLMSQPNIEKAGEILASNSEYSENSLAQSSGIEMFEEAFGITSNITSFSQEAMGLPFFNTFNNVASELGLLFSLKQFAFEIYEGKEEQAKLNLAKNLTLYSLGKWGTRSLKIANAGIFFIDYSLTKFGTKGLEVREEKYQKEYDILLPWQSPRRDKIFWTRFITDVVLSTKDFNASLDKEMDVYLKYPFTQKDFPKDLQEILIQKEKEKLLKILHEAVKDAKNQLEEKRKKEILDKFGKMKSMLNEKIGILVRVFEGDKAAAGVPVKIIVNKDQHLWQGKTDHAGQWWFDCTWLGYLYYGKPTVVELQYKDTTYKRNLSIDNWRNGRIEFILDGEEEEEEKLSAEVSIIEPIIKSIDLKEGKKNHEVYFTAQANDSSKYCYFWDFGDGKTYEDKPGANKNSKVSNKYTNINENSSFKVTVKLFPLESQEEFSTSSILIKMNSSLSEEEKYKLVMATIPDVVKNHDIGWTPDYTDWKLVVRDNGNNNYCVEYIKNSRQPYGKSIMKAGDKYHVDGYYNNNTRWAKSTPHGHHAIYYLNGELFMKWEKDMGRTVGYIHQWHKNGQKNIESRIENGKVIEKRTWFENGVLAKEEDFINGTETCWHMNGKKRVETFLNEHGKHGKFIAWDKKGRIVSEGNYENGKRKGIWYSYSHKKDGTKITREQTY